MNENVSDGVNKISNVGWDETGFPNVVWDGMGRKIEWDGTRFFQTWDGMGRDFLNVGWDGMKNRMGWDGLGMNPGRKTDFSFGTVPLNIPIQDA